MVVDHTTSQKHVLVMQWLRVDRAVDFCSCVVVSATCGWCCWYACDVAGSGCRCRWWLFCSCDVFSIPHALNRIMMAKLWFWLGRNCGTCKTTLTCRIQYSFNSAPINRNLCLDQEIESSKMQSKRPTQVFRAPPTVNKFAIDTRRRSATRSWQMAS